MAGLGCSVSDVDAILACFAATGSSPLQFGCHGEGALYFEN